MSDPNNTGNETRTPEEIERRRNALRARKKKREQVKMMLIAGMAVIAILVVVLVVMAISALTKHLGGGKPDSTPTPTEETETEAPTENPNVQVSDSGVVTSTEKGFLQVKLANQPFENVESLDTANIGWGYGPSRDEQNRPVDAVQNDELYAKYGAYFVQSGNNEKVIYLTMDEGYEYGYTPALLDTFKELDVKITFFVTLPFVEEHPDLVQRMIDEGHIVGNHSVNHPADGLPSESIEEQKAEVTGVHDALKEKFDYESWLFRFPAGKFSEQSLAILSNLGYRSVFWSFAHYDYDVENQPDEAEALQKCLDSLHPGAIYLLHAVSETNTNNMKAFIEGARERGYTFEQIPAEGWRLQDSADGTDPGADASADDGTDAGDDADSSADESTDSE